MCITRRNFIKSIGLTGVWITIPELLFLTANATNANVSKKSKILVVVQMNGGNDGLNTVVPYKDAIYYQLRPTIAVPPSVVLPINDQIGFNPNLQAFADLYHQGALAIVQSVGYPNPNRSHFRSMEIWQTAVPDRIVDTSWQERYLNSEESSCEAVIELDSSFEKGLKSITKMICAGANSKIYNISLNGFDTHANQTKIQNGLLKQLGDGLAAFLSDLKAHGIDNEVVVLCFTEFGRRLAENSEQGTDHGTAGPVFIIGSAVRGGVYGIKPDLADLDQGDLKHRIDFRSVYASILDGWMSTDSKQVLGAHYDQIPFV